MKHLHNRINRVELKQNLERSTETRTTISFYKYAKIGNVRVFRDHFFQLLHHVGVLGRVYVSHEGVNAQISVPESNMERLRNALNEIVFLRDCRLNIAIEEPSHSFYKLQVKRRNKIVADGLDSESFDVADNAEHIDAITYNKLTDNPDTVIIDMRNHYESEVGHFSDAITPDVETFRESLPIVEDILKENKQRPVIMYCTGGIRCEKATAYFKSKGYDNLLQLEGGIIEYTRQTRELGIENKFVGKKTLFLTIVWENESVMISLPDVISADKLQMITPIAATISVISFLSNASPAQKKWKVVVQTSV